jgi:hypothetical protein
MTDQLDMPDDGIWPDSGHLHHYQTVGCPLLGLWNAVGHGSSSQS